MTRTKKLRWYHGDTSSRASFLDQKWDRDRTTASANENGPGLYFTSSYEEAATYGPYVYEGEPKESFRMMPKRKPTMSFLMDIFRSANDDDKETFLSNWGIDGVSESKAKIALSKYLGQNTMHDAAVSLYGDLIRRPEEWVEAMRFAGYDGVVVDRSYGKKHLVVWSPEKLKIYEVGA